ncbi:MAG: pilin, partial [Gammaproteobacteria bacterium]|nr:pilin [Gammaproteobacteria bacterium]
IELMIVVAIIGILASVGMGAYQTYMIRAQISEGITLAAAAKTPVLDAYQNNGEAPADRDEAGMTANAADTQGSYVASVAVNNGRLEVTYGNGANEAIANETLYLTPYETATGGIVWRCGNESQPSGGGGPLNTMGAAGGGNSATFQATNIDERYLPKSCRD